MTKTTALALVLTLTVGLGACHKAAAPAAAPPRTVSVTRVESRALPGGLTTSGLLISREEAAVFPEVTGYRVAKVLVEADAKVSQGQPLAMLDDALLKSQIAQQTALVAQQQVAAEQAASQAQHIEGLDGQGVLSTEQIDQRRFQARSAKAALEAQKAQLADLKIREERMTIRAPVGGLVLERNVRPGDIAAVGATPMFRMIRDDLVELQAQVPEAAIGQVRVGDKVQVLLPTGAALTGQVRFVEPGVDSQTKLGKVRISLPVRDDLRPGGFARATFAGLGRTAVTVPETAIRYDADGASVMVVDQNDRVSQVPVKTGDHAGGYVELVQGPPAGARVLQAAASFVLPGDVIRPAEQGQAGAR
ncbi:efflux RND transporter periplasmic adaptor subunit [Phenylobacterium montanum]|uniref:Efflux RND transporter periplasmic adaptor subunit n=2 Tax=Phenylobacterium montanum TaxID=2823693 RepID=A0A975G5F1_9CAUL|nr:efflux RND transporter periplasmic adaptor subunit [Caulobacter sp. S6]